MLPRHLAKRILSLFRFPLWAFFQPTELELYASQSSRRRKALLWGHIALYLVTYAACALVLFKFHRAFDITLKSEITLIPFAFTGAIYIIVLVLSLFVSGVLKKDNLTSFVIAVYWSFLGGLLLLSTMWIYARFRQWNWSQVLLGNAVTILVFILVWSLVSNIYGRTRRYWAMIVLFFAAACFGASVAYRTFAYSINSHALVKTSNGHKYLAINPPKRFISFDYMLMSSILGSAETIALIDIASGERHDVNVSAETLARMLEAAAGYYRVNEDALASLKSSVVDIERDGRPVSSAFIRLKREIDSLEGKNFSDRGELFTTRESLLDTISFLDTFDTFGDVARNESRSRIKAVLMSPDSFKRIRGEIELGQEKYTLSDSLIERSELPLIDGLFPDTIPVNSDVSIKPDENQLIKVRRGAREVSVNGDNVLDVIQLDRNSLYVQTNLGFFVIDLEKMELANLKTQEWYQHPSFRHRQVYYSLPLETYLTYALTDGKNVYGLSPSGYFFTFDPQSQNVTLKSVFASELGFFSHRHLYYLFLYYFIVGLLLLLFGLYRMPSYLAECAWQFILAPAVAFRILSPSRAVKMSALTFDHVSTMRLPFTRYLLRRLAKRDPKAFMAVLTYLLTKTNRKRTATRAGLEFFSQNPNALFEFVYRSLRADGGSLLLTLLAHTKRESPLTDLLRSYSALLKESPRKPLLSWHIVVVSGFADKGYLHAREVYLTYKIFEDFLAVSDLRGLTDVDRALAEILQINYGDLLNPQVVEIFNIVVDLVGDLKNYEIVDSFRDKQYYLSEARIKLYDISARAKETLASPEREIVLEVVEGWQGVIVGESKALRGPAELVLSLLNKSLAGDGDWQSVVVRVRNVGQSPAENIRVSLLGNENVSVREPSKHFNVLGIGDELQAEFSINPLGNSNELRLYIDTTFDDFERKDKLRPFADIVKLSTVSQEYVRIPNPYIVGTPLQNQKVFFGRERALRFALDNMSSGLQNNVLIFFGQRRVGKSSLLYRLADSSLKDEYVFVYIDCQGFADADTAKLLYRICQSIATSAAKAQVPVEAPVLSKFVENTFLELDNYLDRIEPALGEKKIALMFDEYEFLEYKAKDGSVSPELFNKLRNLMQHRNKRLGFIFVGTHRLTELTESYWSFLFNTALYHEIGSLSESEARALITEPVKGYLRYDNLVVDKILRVTGLHPYFIQVTCRLIVNFCNQHRKSYITLTDLNEILKEAVEGSTAHVKYLYNDFSTKPEQEMLSFLARLTDEAKLSATAQEISRFAVENKFNYDTRAVREILSTLRNKKLIREEGERGDLFGFEYEFLRIWIERHVRVQSGFVSVG